MEWSGIWPSSKSTSVNICLIITNRPRKILHQFVLNPEFNIIVLYPCSLICKIMIMVQSECLSGFCLLSSVFGRVSRDTALSLQTEIRLRIQPLVTYRSYRKCCWQSLLAYRTRYSDLFIKPYLSGWTKFPLAKFGTIEKVMDVYPLLLFRRRPQEGGSANNSPVPSLSPAHSNCSQASSPTNSQVLFQHSMGKTRLIFVYQPIFYLCPVARYFLFNSETTK